MTVPAGVTKIRLRGQIGFEANATGYREIVVYKNGSANYSALRFRDNGLSTGASASPYLNLISPVYTVTAGDYFELMAYQNSGGALYAAGGATDLAAQTWFEMEIVG